MSQHRITFKKSFGWFGAYQWRCNIYDRKTGLEYSGIADTKREAKSKAWDDYWDTKDNKEYNSRVPVDEPNSSNYSSYNPTRYPSVSIEGLIFSFLGMGIAVGGFLWGHNYFEEAKNLSYTTFKGGLGPAIGIIVMGGSIVAFLFCLYGFFMSLFNG